MGERSSLVASVFVRYLACLTVCLSLAPNVHPSRQGCEKGVCWRYISIGIVLVIITHRDRPVEKEFVGGISASASSSSSSPIETRLWKRSLLEVHQHRHRLRHHQIIIIICIMIITICTIILFHRLHSSSSSSSSLSPSSTVTK